MRWNGTNEIPKSRPALVLSTRARPACQAHSPPGPGPSTGEASEPESWRIPSASNASSVSQALQHSLTKLQACQVVPVMDDVEALLSILLYALHCVLRMPHKEVEDWGGCAIRFLDEPPGNLLLGCGGAAQPGLDTLENLVLLACANCSLGSRSGEPGRAPRGRVSLVSRCRTQPGILPAPSARETLVISLTLARTFWRLGALECQRSRRLCMSSALAIFSRLLFGSVFSAFGGRS